MEKKEKTRITKRSKGRPRLDEYVHPDQLTDMMERFCQGISSGQTASQVGTALNMGVQKIKAYLNNVAIQTRIEQLKDERSLKSDDDKWEELEELDLELLKQNKIAMIAKIMKGEIPWAVMREIDKWGEYKHGTIGRPTSTEVEATEEQSGELTTRDLLKGHEEDLQYLEDMTMDPTKLPVALGGKKKTFRRRRLKVTKKEG